MQKDKEMKQKIIILFTFIMGTQYIISQECVYSHSKKILIELFLNSTFNQTFWSVTEMCFVRSYLWPQMNCSLILLQSCKCNRLNTVQLSCIIIIVMYCCNHDHPYSHSNYWYANDVIDKKIG